ncbi:hypothetical protein PIB30_078477, partial [Stylosanthes scabra]|nr:hypothetical protein [Stylosanthes scabra]
SLWYHKWKPNGCLAHQVPFVHVSDTNLTINDVWFDGQWNLELLSSWLSHELKIEIQQYNPSLQIGSEPAFMCMIARPVLGVLSGIAMDFGLETSNMAMNQDITDLQAKIIDILHWDWTARIQLIQREANSVADSMAKAAAMGQHDYVEWIVPQHSLVPLIRMDSPVLP